MKNYIHTTRYIFILIALLSLISCKKKFLDVNPLSSVSDENPINDKSSAETAVRGIYSALSQNGYYGINYQSIGYLSGDNLEFTGTVVSQNQFIQHQVRADNASLSESWLAIYDAINRANHVIEKVPNVTDAKLTLALKNQLQGEAYFIRALAYFDLLRVWGGVPLILKPTVIATDNQGKGRNSTEEVYAQILSDLKTAAPLLASTLSTNKYRANKQTVNALRARYHLYRGEWAEAESFASLVIADNSYALLAPYNSWFANGVLATRESVFELSFNVAFVVSTSAHRNSWQPTTNGGNKNWVPNAAFIKLVNDTLTGGNRKTIIAKSGTTTYGNLYYRLPAVDPAYVFRIAELYLTRAEARAQLGNISGSLEDLNAIRKRAGLANSLAATQEEVLLAIEKERRLEFAFEPHRWFDLVRTGRADDVLGITDPNKLVLPIPINEIKADPSLTQNPGY